MDSLDIVQVVVEIERSLQLEITDREAEALLAGRADALWRVIAEAQAGHAIEGPPEANDEVWTVIRRAISKIKAVPMDDVGPDYLLQS